jgi:DNA polymerase III epsilon subunit-like protein
MFNKDLLMLDIEATGTDVTKHEIIQLAGIVLDKKTLKEKKSFTSYVKPENWKNRDPEAMAVCNITWDQLKDAPSLKSVLTNFDKTFGKNVIPTTYGGNLDIVFLPAAYRKAKMKYPFEYHTFNIWPLCYAYMAQRKQLKNDKRFVGFSLEDLGDYLNVKRMPGRHDALGDCLYQANIMRALLKRMKAEAPKKVAPHGTRKTSR